MSDKTKVLLFLGGTAALTVFGFVALCATLGWLGFAIAVAIIAVCS